MKKSPRKTQRPAKAKPTPPASPPEAPDPADEQAFVESLVASGQAAVRDPRDGSLPPGVTHELVSTPDGKLKAIRRRFSAY